MSQIVDKKKYANDARKLNIVGLQERFDTHKKLRRDEIELLFKDEIPKGGLTDMQIRYLKKAVDKQTFHFDTRLLQTLSHNLFQCHQIVGHYSTKFDYPYFNTRCLLTDQTELIPDYGYLYHQDTWRMMKRSMKAPRNTLKNFIRLTGGVDEKTFVDLRYWYITHFKDHKEWKKSMNYIIDHCTKDVRMTYLGLLKVELFNPVSRVKV